MQSSEQSVREAIIEINRKIDAENREWAREMAKRQRKAFLEDFTSALLHAVALGVALYLVILFA